MTTPPSNLQPRRDIPAGGHRVRPAPNDDGNKRNGPAGRRQARRDENHARKRRKILEIAGRHFIDHGYAAETMSAIASELGGTKTTLWDNFPSKQDTLQAFLTESTSFTCAIRLY